MEVSPLSNRRRENRDILQRLFQGYINDFGNDDGWKIIKVIIFELGGIRMQVPRDINRKGELLEAFYNHICEDFGESSGTAIINKFITELGGLRISFPTFEELYRQERNEKIRARYNGWPYGSNIEVLAEQWGISGECVRKIVREAKDNGN
jgi:Mor family transcriptional regulator